MSTTNPTVRSRQLGVELRKHRVAARLTCEQAGRALGMSAAKISRLENGKNAGSVEDIALLLGLYRVAKKDRNELLSLGREVNERGWWNRHGTRLPAELTTLVELESNATTISNFECMWIPGLLQTGAYARAVIAGAGGLSESEVEERVVARLGRQAMLVQERPPTLEALVDEQALWRPVGGQAVMAEQIEYLRYKADREQITLRIVPVSGGVHAGMTGPFVLLDGADSDSVVYLENAVSSLFLEDESDISTYRSILSSLRGTALSSTDSLDLLSRLATHYARPGDDSTSAPGQPLRLVAVAKE